MNLDVTFNLRIQDCLFEENVSKSDYGSALLVTTSSNGKANAKITNSQFIRNSSKGYFTAAFLSNDESEIDVQVEDCIFLGNVDKDAPQSYCAAFSAGGQNINTRTKNCVFAYNGAAIFAGGNEEAKVFTQVTNCTFFRNGEQPFGKWWFPAYSQAGSSYYNKMHFYNCSIWEPGVVHDLFDNNNPNYTNALMFYLDYCSFHPLQPAGIPNFSEILGDSIFIGAYPEFIDTLNGNFRLSTCSPIMDKGDNQAVINAGILTDLEGYSRIRYNTVDIGAYETQDSCITISNKEPLPISATAMLSPNPASPGIPLDIQVFDLEHSPIDWVMRDAYGCVITSGKTLLLERGHFSVTAPSSPGIYFIELQSGGQSVWLKFVVQR